VINGQLGHPRGPLGHVVARNLAKNNLSLNDWMVDLLAVQPQDRVLEVGCGPGTALQRFVAQASQGQVVGLDLSAVALSQAVRRNKTAVASGRLVVRIGDAAALDLRDGWFDKVASTHVLYFWQDPARVYAELSRVLAPGGGCATAYQEGPRMPAPAQASFLASGRKLYTVGQVERLYADAGFREVRTEAHEGPHGPEAFCTIGTKGLGS
jgi:ubiquinone/menaquinone biosynthesis C-methylase UbiE